jgi:hypothetical protein
MLLDAVHTGMRCTRMHALTTVDIAHLPRDIDVLLEVIAEQRRQFSAALRSGRLAERSAETDSTSNQHQRCQYEHAEVRQRRNGCGSRNVAKNRNDEGTIKTQPRTA